jgi:hypothetical protein
MFIYTHLYNIYQSFQTWNYGLFLTTKNTYVLEVNIPQKILGVKM